MIKLEFPPPAEQKDPLTIAMYKYAKENLALVNIYIKDPAVTQIKREQKIPLIWFVANVGGILGLTMGCSLVTVFEILLHVGLILYRTWIKSTTTIKRRLTCTDGKAALNTMMSAAAPNNVKADVQHQHSGVGSGGCGMSSVVVNRGHHDTLSDLTNCSADSSPRDSSSHAKWSRLRHQQGNNFSSVEIIEAKSANGLMVAHHASCVIDDATTTVHNNTHRKYSKHFCGGGGGKNCNRTTSSSPKTTTNLKSRSCKHSRSTSTSPLKRCNNMLQPTITTNTVSIFEDEDIPHYHS